MLPPLNPETRSSLTVFYRRFTPWLVGLHLHILFTPLPPTWYLETPQVSTVWHPLVGYNSPKTPFTRFPPSPHPRPLSWFPFLFTSAAFPLHLLTPPPLPLHLSGRPFRSFVLFPVFPPLHHSPFLLFLCFYTVSPSSRFPVISPFVFLSLSLFIIFRRFRFSTVFRRFHRFYHFYRFRPF